MKFLKNIINSLILVISLVILTSGVVYGESAYSISNIKLNRNESRYLENISFNLKNGETPVTDIDEFTFNLELHVPSETVEGTDATPHYINIITSMAEDGTIYVYEYNSPEQSIDYISVFLDANGNMVIGLNDNYLSRHVDGVNIHIADSDGNTIIEQQYTDQEYSDLLDQEEEENREYWLNYDGVSWFEQVITWFVLIVCDAFRNCIHAICGNVSIDDILFNGYSKTRLAIFGSNSGSNSFLSGSGMLGSDGILEQYFILFRNIAIAIYLVMLLYVGVRILLASTGSKKDRYKNLLMDWVKGILILALFPYVMKYVIVINDGIVSYVSSIRSMDEFPGRIPMPSLTEGVSDAMAEALGVVGSDTAVENGNLMNSMRSQAIQSGRLVYAMLYLFLIKQLVSFLYIYFKRLIVVIFLIVIFPLVTISYAIDKIGDGKSQAFNNWFKEYTLNVFLQSFQAVNYLIIMSVIFALTGAGGTTNIILVLLGISYISKGDELLRGLFSKMSGGGAKSLPGSLSEATKTIATAKVAESVINKVGSAGKRIGNMKKAYQDVRNSYYGLQETKHEQSVKEKEQAKYNMEHSYFNPEKVATDDVAGNIKTAFNTLGSNSPEEVKKALDRLNVAKNDPERKAMFEKEYNNLSDADKERLDKLMVANDAINQTVNDNKRIDDAPLTNLEINLNANILLDVIGGGDTGLYKDLFAYSNSQKMKDVKDDNGRNISLNEYLNQQASERVLNDKEQKQFAKAQQFIGNVTQLDSSSRCESRAGTKVNNNPLPVEYKTKDEKDRARRILNKYGTVNSGTVSRESAEKQERAANLVARMQKYKFMIDQGSSEGVSATEARQLSKEWTELSKELDEGVHSILSQLGDAETAGHDMEANVGFTKEQFEAITSMAVIKDQANLVGTEEEKAAMIDDALTSLLAIETEQRDAIRVTDGARVKQTYKPDKVTKAILQRAEIDDLINKHKAAYQDGAEIKNAEYIRTKATQEQLRDEAELKRIREEIEKEYDEIKETTVAQARGDLIRNSVKAVGATASVAAAPLSVASGITSAALYAGMAGSLDKPVELLGATAIGVELEHSIEKLIPGTEPANSSKKSFGSRVDRFANDKINDSYGLTPAQKDEEFLRRERMKHNLRAKNDIYKSRLK